jgi:small subunit ribosomal protein S9
LAEEAQDRYYATGHRKDATAKVWLTPGTGKITINKIPSGDYLRRRALDILIRRPLELVEMADKIDIDARVLGGGVSGQAGAVKHGIAKALVKMDPDLRPPLRRIGYLTRDPRVKESKKYGRKRARRAFQFTKR